MAYKIVERDVDGRDSTFIAEAYEGEIDEAFLEADREAGERVEVIYMIDNNTGEDIEIWRPLI